MTTLAAAVDGRESQGAILRFPVRSQKKSAKARPIIGITTRNGETIRSGRDRRNRRKVVAKVFTECPDPSQWCARPSPTGRRGRCLAWSRELLVRAQSVGPKEFARLQWLQPFRAAARNRLVRFSRRSGVLGCRRPTALWRRCRLRAPGPWLRTRRAARRVRVVADRCAGEWPVGSH